MPVLNKYDIIDCRFLMPPQEYGQKFQVRIVKMIYDHEKKLAKDLVISSSYILLMVINTKRLYHTMILSIALKTKRMIILCENSKLLFPMMDCLAIYTPTQKDLVIMSRLNG